MSDEPSIPGQLRYTAEHEWAQLSTSPDESAPAAGPTGGTVVVRVGITDYAQAALGDIVFVQLPEVGSAVSPGEAVGEVESTKSVSDLFAPLSGIVSARNDSVETNPELANTDPYGQGWLIELTIDDPAALDALLDAAAYRALTAS